MPAAAPATETAAFAIVQATVVLQDAVDDVRDRAQLLGPQEAGG